MGQIQYSEKYFDDTFEYRCAVLFNRFEFLGVLEIVCFFFWLN